MFKIGDFSNLTRVPVRTLHYYDDIGLFTPQHVDPFTGYRYYSFEQLPRLNRILALKDLGFALEQIAHMLDENISADELSGMLRLRRAELQQQVEDTQERLARVEARLKQIREEGKMSEHEILIKRVEPVKIASAREVVAAPEQMRERCTALLDAACELIKQADLKGTGTTLALYHDNSLGGIDVEMAEFLSDSTNPSAKLGQAGVRELPAVETMATVVYHGSYDNFAAVGELHAAMGRWIENNGYRINGPNREIYLHYSPGADGVMELQYPVVKA
jgi:DNA-binding transcriptional MerR regulator